MAKINMSQLKEDPPKPNDRLLIGYGVDDVAIYKRVKLSSGTEVCRQCEGTGEIKCSVGYDGFERIEYGSCHNCDGEGTVYFDDGKEE